MTKKLFIVCAALVWTVALVAQNISVVSPGGSTIMCKTLTQAVDTAAAGSVIYLPGGYFDENKNIVIKKKLTIIGIGHNTKSDNPDGHTIIDDAIYFHEGSDGSALMGCKASSIIIGNYGSSNIPPTNDILLRGNRLSSVYLYNTTSGTVIDQNIITSAISYSNYSYTKNYGATITNNVVYGINGLNEAEISNNIICGSIGGSPYYGVYQCSRSSITGNIIMNGITTNNVYDNSASGNMMTAEYIDDDPIIVGGEGFNWSSVFVKYDSSYPYNSDFHFSDEYKKYEGKVGIYAGTGFSDKPLAPVPYIVAKHVDQNTDASGKLNIKVRVKASGDE